MSPSPASRPCRAFLDDFSTFVDGHMPPARRGEIQAHVDCCQGCLDHLTAYRRGITVLRSIEAEAAPDFWERVERRLWRGGDPLTVLEGGGGPSGHASRAGGWPRPTVAVAAAAVLALFVIVRGLGPEATSGPVGPQRVQASVAMTLPEVPESGAFAGPGVTVADTPVDGVRTVARASRQVDQPANGSADPAKAVLTRVDSRRASPLEIESMLVSDGWVQPARQLVRPASAVTPSPWNVDRAVSLP